MLMPFGINLITERRIIKRYRQKKHSAVSYISIESLNAKPHVSGAQISSQNGPLCLSLDSSALMLTNFTSDDILLKYSHH